MNIFKIFQLVMFIRNIMRDGKVDESEFIELIHLLDVNKDGKLSTKDIKSLVQDLF